MTYSRAVIMGLLVRENQRFETETGRMLSHQEQNEISKEYSKLESDLHLMQAIRRKIQSMKEEMSFAQGI